MVYYSTCGKRTKLHSLYTWDDQLRHQILDVVGAPVHLLECDHAYLQGSTLCNVNHCPSVMALDQAFQSALRAGQDSLPGPHALAPTVDPKLLRCPGDC
jgi:hypothetical protein